MKNYIPAGVLLIALILTLFINRDLQGQITRLKADCGKTTNATVSTGDAVTGSGTMMTATEWAMKPVAVIPIAPSDGDSDQKKEFFDQIVIQALKVQEGEYNAQKFPINSNNSLFWQQFLVNDKRKLEEMIRKYRGMK